MEQPLILALDIGSSSVRAGIYDGNAEPVRSTAVKIDWAFNTTPDGGSEMDAEDAFRTVVKAIDGVLEKSAKLKREIEYVVSCAFWHSLVGVDKRGKPTTRVLGWADTRSRKYSGILKKRFNEREIHDHTGAHFHSSFWPAKLLWMRKEFPETFAKTARWISFSDFVLERLIDADEMPLHLVSWVGPTGIRFIGPKQLYQSADNPYFTSISMASATGIFDIRECKWDAGLMKFLKLSPHQLPQIVSEAKHSFKLKRKYKRRWPQLKGAEIFPAIGDGAADNIGAGCVTKSRAALMVGTSGAMRVAYNGEPPETIPDGLWCYRIDRKRVIIGGALSDGGNLYTWLKRNLNLPKDAERQIAKRPLGLHGLRFDPFFAGMRSTEYDETAKGLISGLTLSHDAVDIMQAAVEAVALKFKKILDQLNNVVEIKEIVASGGALRDSSIWRQIISEVLGRKLMVNDATESSLRGAVLLALKTIGKMEHDYRKE